MSMIVNGVRFRTDIRLPNIRSDVPFPKHAERVVKFRKEGRWYAGRQKKYDVSAMEVGDSFLYGGNHNHVSGHINYFKLTTGFNFIYKQTDQGIRIWRIK